MTVNACFPLIVETKPNDNICENTVLFSLEQKLLSSNDRTSSSNFKEGCGGNISQALSAPWSFDRSKLFTTALPFSPIFNSDNFDIQYDHAKESVYHLHQRIIRLEIEDDSSIDKAFESLSVLEQSIAAVDHRIAALQFSPGDQSNIPLLEAAAIDWENFSNSLFSNEKLYLLVIKLKSKIKNYQGKYPKNELEATLLKWIGDLKSLGAALPPNKKSELLRELENVKKVEIEYQKAFDEKDKDLSIPINLESLIGFDPKQNSNIVKWISRLFIRGERGVQSFLDSYNLQRNAQNVCFNENSSSPYLSTENLARGLSHDLIQYLRNEYFPTHLNEFNEKKLSDLKIPIIRDRDGYEFYEFVENTRDEKAMIEAYGAYWRYIDKIVTPKVITLVQARQRVAKILGFSNYAELKSLDGQTLYANPAEEVNHWIRVGEIVKRVTRTNWEKIAQFQKENRPKALSPLYETSQPYKDLLFAKITEVKTLLSKTEFGSPETFLRETVIPSLERIYGESYEELTGEILAAYTSVKDTIVFGNNCSVFIWDLFHHPGKRSGASSITIREIGKRSFFETILIPFGPKKSNPQVKFKLIPLMIHEPIHPASYQTPLNGQSNFFNLGIYPNFSNDLLTVFAQTEYVQRGMPDGIDFWKLGMIADEKNPNQKRKLTSQEIDRFKLFARLETLEGLERQIPRGIFLYDIHRNPPSSSAEMGKRFSQIAKQTYNEPFSKANELYAFNRSWNQQLGWANYGPVAITVYQNADLFYPYLSFLFEKVGGGLKPENFRLLQEMYARVSAMPPPQKGSRGYIDLLKQSMDQMLSELHQKYGDRVSKVPNRFDIEDVYQKFEEYYKKSIKMEN